MRATGLLRGWRRRSVRATAPLIVLSLVLTRPAFGIPPLPGAVPPSAAAQATPAPPPAPGVGATAAPAQATTAAPPPYPSAPTPPPPGAGPSAPGWIAPGPPGPPPPPWYPYAPPSWQGVYVELRADNARVRIDRVIDGGNTVPVCEAPCRRVLDRNNVYVIQGDGVTPTSQFLLPDNRGNVTLDVRAGSTGQRAVGSLLVVGGGAVALLGYTVASLDGSFSDSSGNRDRSRSGLIMMAIGIPVAALGFYLSATARTSVASSSGATFSEARPAARKHPLVALTPRGLEF